MKLKLMIVGTETHTMKIPIFLPSGISHVSVTFDDNWQVQDIFTHPAELEDLNLDDDELRLFTKQVMIHAEYLNKFARKNRLRFTTNTAFDDDDFVLINRYEIKNAEYVYSL